MDAEGKDLDGMSRRASLLSLLGLAATVTVAVLTIGSPAWADSKININPGNVPTTAAGYGTHACDPNQGGGPYPGKDVWVFVLPGNHNATGDFISVTADFGTHGTITITTAANAGNFANGGPATSKAWIVTPAGWTLVGATAEISGTARFFNLTHTCPASASPGPSPSTGPPTPTPHVSTSSSPAPSPSGPASPPDAATPSGPVGQVPSGGANTGGGGGRPTGSLGWGLAALAIATGAGVTLVVIYRRRKNA
jgi:hypothetical protein